MVLFPRAPAGSLVLPRLLNGGPNSTHLLTFFCELGARVLFPQAGPKSPAPPQPRSLGMTSLSELGYLGFPQPGGGGGGACLVT